MQTAEQIALAAAWYNANKVTLKLLSMFTNTRRLVIYRRDGLTAGPTTAETEFIMPALRHLISLKLDSAADDAGDAPDMLGLAPLLKQYYYQLEHLELGPVNIGFQFLTQAREGCLTSMTLSSVCDSAHTVKELVQPFAKTLQHLDIAVTQHSSMPTDSIVDLPNLLSFRLDCYDEDLSSGICLHLERLPRLQALTWISACKADEVLSDLSTTSLPALTDLMLESVRPERDTGLVARVASRLGSPNLSALAMLRLVADYNTVVDIDPDRTGNYSRDVRFDEDEPLDCRLKWTSEDAVIEFIADCEMLARELEDSVHNAWKKNIEFLVLESIKQRPKGPPAALTLLEMVLGKVACLLLPTRANILYRRV